MMSRRSNSATLMSEIMAMPCEDSQIYMSKVESIKLTRVCLESAALLLLKKLSWMSSRYEVET